MVVAAVMAAATRELSLRGVERLTAAAATRACVAHGSGVLTIADFARLFGGTPKPARETRAPPGPNWHASRCKRGSMSRRKRHVSRYGWIPDLPDHRDFIFAAPRAVLRKLPARVNLTAKCPPVYDQGEIGSCTANAIGAAIEFDQMKQRIRVFMPSRLFIYYNERLMENTVNEDSGAMIRDGIKSVAKQGNCPEKMWPYDPTPFPPNPHLTEKPSKTCYKEGLKHTAVQYQRITRSLPQMKGCLAAGYPFVLGFTVYESFESDAVARTGRMPMPSPRERVVGGHAVLAVGYDDRENSFRMRNSWGTKWGRKGYFTMPYAYLLDENLSDDFWQITLVKA